MPKPVSLTEPIWEQQPGETDTAYHAARVFFELGVKRDLVKTSAIVYARPARDRAGPGPKPARGKAGQVGKWCKDYRWRERATAYDAHLRAAKDRATVKAVESAEARRVRLRAENDENAVVVADQLTVKALEMLQWPLAAETTTTTTVDPSGKAVTVVKTVEPARWTMATAGELLKVAKLIRDAALGVTPTPPGVADPPPAEDASMKPIRSVQILTTVTSEPGPGG